MSRQGTPCSAYVKAFLPATLASVALVCGMAGANYCETFQFPHSNGATLYTGLWMYRTKDWFEFDGNVWVYTTCKSYRNIEDRFGFDYDIDSKTRTAMAFSIITPVIGGIVNIFAWIAPCGGRHEGPWRGFGLLFLLACLFQGLVLLMMSSSICEDNPVLQLLDAKFPVVRSGFEDECEMGPGYKLLITATVFWGLAGLYPFVFAPPRLDAEVPQQTQTVTYQKNEDGTVTEQNVTVVKGNSVPEQQIESEE